MKVDESLFYAAEQGLNDSINHLTLARHLTEKPYPQEYKYQYEIDGVRTDLDTVFEATISLIEREKAVRNALIELGSISSKSNITLLASENMNISYDTSTFEGRAAYIYDKLVNQYGYSDAGARIMIANMAYEDDTLVADRHQSDNPNFPGYGLCQWEWKDKGGTVDRADQMKAYCDSIGMDYTTIDGQLAWLDYELKTKYVNDYDNLYGKLKVDVDKNSNEYYTLAMHFCSYYIGKDNGYDRTFVPKAQEAFAAIDNINSNTAEAILNTVDVPIPDVNSVFDNSPGPQAENYPAPDYSYGPGQETENYSAPVYDNNPGPQVENYENSPYNNIPGPGFEMEAENITPENTYVEYNEPNETYSSQEVPAPSNTEISSSTSKLDKVIALYNGEYGESEISRRQALGSEYDEIMNQLRQNVLDGHYTAEEMVIYN